MWDASGRRTQFEYDALNRLVKTTLPNLKTATTVWNVNGTKQSETDFSGNVIAYGYDALARLNAVTQTNGATAQVTRYGFDNLGNKVSQTDAEGRVTRWEYDSGNRITSRTLPGGQKESFTYDAVGNLTGKTDFAGAATGFGINAIGQVNQVTRADGTTIVSTYTASGQVASVTVTGSSGIQSGRTTYTYDANDRVTRQTNPDGSYLAYGYDANGNIVQRSTAAGTVSYTYDVNQRIDSVTDTAGKTTVYRYDASGRPDTVALPNGVVTKYQYDFNSRLQQLVHANGTAIVTGVRYTVADNGQRTKVEEFDNLSTQVSNVLANPARTRDYQYDTVGRLTQEKVTDRSQIVVRTTGYTYDKVGNRIGKTDTTPAGVDTTTYAYDSNDRLTTETRTTGTGSAVITAYTWDANGNLKTKAVGGSVLVYGWNADNRLIEVKQGSTDAAAQTIARYRYDSIGNRVSKTEPGQNGQADVVTSYLVDTTFPYAQTVQESVTQGQATTSTSYVWGRDLIQQVRSGQGSYYHADGLGSVKTLTDSTGSATDQYVYDAFGNVERHDGSASNAYRYTGEYFDDQIGLQYNRARWYNAIVGKFTTQDDYPGELEKPVTLNKYIYANDNPVSNRDPSGAMSLGEAMAVNAAIGAVTSLSVGLYLGKSTKQIASDMLWGAAFGAAFGGAFQFASFVFSGTRTAVVTQTEVWYRVMSEADYLILQTTGKLPASALGETMISPTVGYLEQVGYKGVLVEFEMNPGFLSAMENIGVRDTSAVLTQVFPKMPTVSGGWMATKAFFKMEGSQTNIGLGKGTALDLFNSSMQAFKRVSGL